MKAKINLESNSLNLNLLSLVICIRTYVEHVINICHLELANSLTKRTLLVIE